MTTADPVAELLWSRLLELQVAIYLPYELQFYYGSDDWTSARRVLDAGCGRGDFLGKLRQHFPDKAYVGLDLSGELLASARHSPYLDGVSLVQSDFLAFQPDAPFDVVMMRLIIQHMSGFDAVFQQLETIVAPRGSVFIVEPDPSQFENAPPLPAFNALLHAYAQATAAQRLNRADLGQITQAAARNGWKIRRDDVVKVPAVGPFRSTPILQVYNLWIDIFEHTRAVAFDFAQVRQELKAWSEREISYSQVGFRFIEATRRAN